MPDAPDAPDAPNNANFIPKPIVENVITIAVKIEPIVTLFS